MACKDCNGVYVGETSRQIKIRVAEHISKWENEKLGISAFADHLLTCGHSYRKGSETLLHREKSKFKRRALEHIEIIRHLNSDNITLLNKYIPDEGLVELVYEYDS